tara:strand:+ start:13175 stop:13720 length:546 start_codon:yes stop_codon:yes gene_type:complete
MKSYIILLRGINVSGQKKIKMADLKNMLEELKFEAVQTYIQSGNIILNTNENSCEVIEEKISKNIFKTFGFEVPILALSTLDFEKIIKDSPFVRMEDSQKTNAYFVLLKNSPEAKLAQNLASETYPNETFSITGNCVYLNCHKGYGNAKCNNNFFEKKLQIQATTRNYKTMMKLLQMAKEN